MSRKRARTSQYGPGNTVKNAMCTPPLDPTLWQLDSNPQSYKDNNPSLSGSRSKARRTSTGRMPINIPKDSANVRVYDPKEYLQQYEAYSPFGNSLYTRPHHTFNNHCMPSASLEVPSPYSSSPTTTVSERFTNTTPCTSVAMSRENSLATSFYGQVGMMRANSGVSEIESPQNMCRQDSQYKDIFSSDSLGVGLPFDSSIYFAHTEGTAIEDPSTPALNVEQIQLPAASEIDTGMRRETWSSSIPALGHVRSPSSLDLHTKMSRDASAESNVSSISRISRRSQEQVAQAARPIAPKDVPESPSSKSSASSLSGGQDMLRQRSAPEPKVSIPRLQYNRQAKEKLKCDRCNKNPDGYRGSHELHRHMALDHNFSRTAWVCVDISPDGFLSGCAACESKKTYGQDYNAAAHLRRFHFHPRSEIRRTNMDPEEKRGGKGGGKDPPMSECRRWMRKIQVPGKDFTVLAGSAGDDDEGDDAGENTIEGDEENQEQQGEQAEAVKDSSLVGSFQIASGTIQPHDTAVDQQISASPVEASNDLELAMNNDRQFNLHTGDFSCSRSGLPSAFETHFETFPNSNAASFIAPGIDLDYSSSILSSSAPAAPSYLSDNPLDPAQAENTFAHSTPSPLDLPSSMSNTRNAQTLEDFSNFQNPYMPGNIPYGMSANNPHFPSGLLPPFH